MDFHTFLQRLRRFVNPNRPAPRRGHSPRPTVEVLEDRVVLDGTFVVPNTNAASLDQAIRQAELAGGGSVVYAPGVTGSVDLSEALPTLTGNLTIQGPGANALTVRGGQAGFTIFTVASGATVKISGLTITGGKAADGG